MDALPIPSGHSAVVEAHLSVANRVLAVAQLGPGFLIIDDPVELPPSDAVLTFSIDGSEHVWPVRLTEGIRPGVPKTTMVSKTAQQAIAG